LFYNPKSPTANFPKGIKYCCSVENNLGVFHVTDKVLQ
jgi:hypothetical protein